MPERFTFVESTVSDLRDSGIKCIDPDDVFIVPDSDK